MITTTINVITELEKTSDLEINDFINIIKKSFENVIIIQIENLQIEYSKFYKYKYRAKFYHDLKIYI